MVLLLSNDLEHCNKVEDAAQNSGLSIEISG